MDPVAEYAMSGKSVREVAERMRDHDATELRGMTTNAEMLLAIFARTPAFRRSGRSSDS
ncbi:hypothetical protein ACIRBX_36235 [Kitasatospora sp. NPDC096147]|uniref:hypothetical protein n=1 Tax=Kitasatospora sp. NPDC096147 TaxID=3364093 RepID=UPI003825F7A8